MAELSPVTDFREACCRQYEQSECTRGGFCNFMHIRPVSKETSNRIDGMVLVSRSRLRCDLTSCLVVSYTCI